jgi:hypothetical protein
MWSCEHQANHHATDSLLRGARRSVRSSHGTTYLRSCSRRRARGCRRAATHARGEQDADAQAHAHRHALTGERLQCPPPPAQAGARARTRGRSGAHGDHIAEAASAAADANIYASRRPRPWRDACSRSRRDYTRQQVTVARHRRRRPKLGRALGRDLFVGWWGSTWTHAGGATWERVGFTLQTRH